MIAKMTPIETLLDWLAKNHYYIGNDLLEKVEELKQMEKLQNHSEYMRGWYNGFNSKEIETNNMEKTAVDWLVEQFNLQAYIPHIEQAKEMEKQQIMDAWVNGGSTLSAKNAEQYYNETFKAE